MYFLTGRGHEEVYSNVSGYDKVRQKEWNGIYYNIDFWYGHPCELKTRRWGLAEEEKEASEYEHYLAQLKGYCALENMPTGNLQVWCLVDKRNTSQKPEFGLYDVEFTEHELEQERERLIRMRNALIFAIDFSDFSDLPICPEWMCGKKHNVMVTKPYCHTCSREFQTDYGLDKHVNSKTGKGHDVTFATYKEVFEPRCKWLMECRGVEVMEQATEQEQPEPAMAEAA
jgi:hypothetical protein